MPRRSMKRAARRPRKRVARKAVPRKGMVALIKKTVMRIAETKEHRTGLSVVPLLHNTPAVVSTNLLLVPTSVTNPAVSQPREGDALQCQYLSFRFLFMTYSDRPNVTFRVWVLKTPPYSPVNGVSPYTYDGWFINRTGQFIMDDINNTQVTVVKTMTFKPPVSDTSQESGSSLHETSYARKMVVPWKKTITYQEQGTATQSSDPKGYTLQLLVAAYDTYGTLITDFAGKMLVQHSLHFKDF